MLNLYLVLYDSLLDNDEDVRNRGAATASKLLSSTASQNDNGDARIPLVVPAARHKLLKWLKHHYHISSDMWMECLQRVLGVPALEKAIKGNRLPSPRRLLEDVRREDIALFVEEKQNLYIDEAQEAGVWQKVLLGLDRSSVNLEVVYKLRAWALEGVHAVTEVSKGEEDGPLGWTSKPDVFTLGTRIILAAEAVLYISRHEGVDIDVMVLRENLQELFLTGEMCDLRPAWMRMLRDILGGIIEEAGNGERGVTT